MVEVHCRTEYDFQWLMVNHSNQQLIFSWFSRCQKFFACNEILTHYVSFSNLKRFFAPSKLKFFFVWSQRIIKKDWFLCFSEKIKSVWSNELLLLRWITARIRRVWLGQTLYKLTERLIFSIILKTKSYWNRYRNSLFYLSSIWENYRQ